MLSFCLLDPSVHPAIKWVRLVLILIVKQLHIRSERSQSNRELSSPVSQDSRCACFLISSFQAVREPHPFFFPTKQTWLRGLLMSIYPQCDQRLLLRTLRSWRWPPSRLWKIQMRGLLPQTRVFFVCPTPFVFPVNALSNWKPGWVGARPLLLSSWRGCAVCLWFVCLAGREGRATPNTNHGGDDPGKRSGNWRPAVYQVLHICITFDPEALLMKTRVMTRAHVRFREIS